MNRYQQVKTFFQDRLPFLRFENCHLFCDREFVVLQPQSLSAKPQVKLLPSGLLSDPGSSASVMVDCHNPQAKQVFDQGVFVDLQLGTFFINTLIEQQQLQAKRTVFTLPSTLNEVERQIYQRVLRQSSVSQWKFQDLRHCSLEISASGKYRGFKAVLYLFSDFTELHLINASQGTAQLSAHNAAQATVATFQSDQVKVLRLDFGVVELRQQLIKTIQSHWQLEISVQAVAVVNKALEENWLAIEGAESYKLSVRGKDIKTGKAVTITIDLVTLQHSIVKIYHDLAEQLMIQLNETSIESISELIHSGLLVYIPVGQLPAIEIVLAQKIGCQTKKSQDPSLLVTHTVLPVE